MSPTKDFQSNLNNHRSTSLKRFTAAKLNQMHLIQDKKYIHDIYKPAEITRTLPDGNNPVVHSACVNLTLVKYIIPATKMLLCWTRTMESET